MPTPLFIVSDSPTSSTGLGRITGYLAKTIHETMPDDFRVGVAGYNGVWSRHIPYPLYPFNYAEGFKIPTLPRMWLDFAGDERGVIMFVLNASWLAWFTHPENLPYGDLKRFLQSDRFEKWIYAPIDSTGPNGRLSASEKQILEKFDRVLAYTQFGSDLIDKTLGNPPATTPHLPHGTDKAVFRPLDQKNARSSLVSRVTGKVGMLNGDITLLGCVATNSSRKDWGLCFEVCGRLLDKGMNIGLWAHTDAAQRHWDLLMLANEFGMKDRVIISNNDLSDEDMAWSYAALDCLLGIGSGEGWGLPLSEALACGIPVVTGNYSGVTEFMPKGLIVEPESYRLDGFHANVRPVYNAEKWAQKILDVIAPFGSPRLSRLSPNHFWSGCWPSWEKWLRGEKIATDPVQTA